MKTFWLTISAYNTGTWPVQLLFVIIAIVLTIALYRKPTDALQRAVKLLLSALSLWIAVAYYFVYCSPRAYSTALGIFWLIAAAIWAFDAFMGTSPLLPVRRHRYVAPFLLAAPLLYPLISLLRGADNALLITPLMPCSVAVFSIGILLAFSPRPNIFITMMMFHWAMIGLFKVQRFHMPEDILTALCIVTAIFLILRDYLLMRRDAILKPSARYISALAVLICTLIFILLIIISCRTLLPACIPAPQGI